MWLQKWESLCTQVLLKQAFSNAQQTTSALKGLINYILDEKEDITYILLRDIQSDPLESKFGWFKGIG